MTEFDLVILLGALLVFLPLTRPPIPRVVRIAIRSIGVILLGFGAYVYACLLVSRFFG